MHDLIDKYCAFERHDADGRVYRTSTRLIRVVDGVNRRAADLLAPVADLGSVVVVFDANTRRVAGNDVVASLEAAGVRHDIIDFNEGTVVCDDPSIDALHAKIAGYSHAIAVGAGTINDLVKMAAHRHGIAYSCIATAPSMNGYTSAIAAILSAGVKTTQPCTPPVAVLADPAVMANAPYRMIASGIGDLYSKPVSNADWRLSHRLLGTPHSPIVMEIIEAGGQLLDGVAPRLPSRDVDAVALLTGSLMLSGLAMQAAGSSQTASGGEHLISHYIDMTSVAFGLSHDFHGCQVAVGTLATSALYEHVRGLDPRNIDVEKCVAAYPDWASHEATLRRRFGPLAESVLPHARKIHATPDEVRVRLSLLVSGWDDIMRDVSTTLRPTHELRDELVSADCPVTFPQINVDRDRAYAAFAWSKDIRPRYTILHLAAELGVLDAFARRWVDDQFAGN